eukprot:CAMPEP_0185827710 /NCGR_PEP_ID=MMETSP1322-20130828/32188_1 /TAXON_ID=265543 /ORGANISM="Minutocellus polymorphus, Strain RCC2270" /LENGTH=287 /DNA_ID=CAMNT_0028525447 /DNA_START=112 /DNA_END=975 /DNA_ORIENTATION=-
MSEYTVLAEISCAVIPKEAPLEKACLFGCGVSTGLGAVWNTCEVETGATVAVFGMGAVGLAVIQGAKYAGASKIIAVDINPDKFVMARKLGATDCVDSSSLDKPVQQHIAGDLTVWGVDYSFDCTGNTDVMRAALECSHRGWGESCVIGGFIGLARLKNHASRNVRIFSSTSADTSSTSVQVLSQIAVTPNNGSLLRIRHSSESTKTDMTFGLFLPGSHKKLLRHECDLFLNPFYSYSTLDGFDPEGLFPSILGHEAGAIVESVGPGVFSVKPGKPRNHAAAVSGSL